ncbi:MAG: diacylglycerol kinase family protein [Dehalococcoidia bacterium]
MNPESILVVANPTSRHMPKREKLLEQLQPLIDEGHRVELVSTAAPGDAVGIAQEASRAGFTRIAACGGDGTLNEVINGVGGDGPVVGVLPAGTGNVWAKEVGISWNIGKAARLLVEGPVRRVDLGVANERKFLLMCSGGLDGAVTARVSMKMKRRLGSTAYVLRGLKMLPGYTPLTSQFELDGETLESTYYIFVVGNSRSYGGAVNITRRAFVDDGLLDVCMIGGDSLTRLARHALRVVLKTHPSAHDILYRRVRSFKLEQAGIPLQIDGEAFGESPLTIGVAPAAVRMVIPDNPSIFAHPPLV